MGLFLLNGIYIQIVSLKPHLFSIVFLLGGGDEEEGAKTVSLWSLPSVWDSKVYVRGLDGMARQIRWKAPQTLFFY